MTARRRSRKSATVARRYVDHVSAGPCRCLLELERARDMQLAYAERFGVALRTAQRHWRALDGPTVPAVIADRWCVLAGVPTASVYGKEW